MLINGKEIPQGSGFDDIINLLESAPEGFNMDNPDGYDQNLDDIFKDFDADNLIGNSPQQYINKNNTTRSDLIGELKRLYTLSKCYRILDYDKKARELLIELKDRSNGGQDITAMPIMQRDYAIINTPVTQIGTNAVLECLVIIARDLESQKLAMFHADRDNLHPNFYENSLDKFFDQFNGSKINIHLYGAEKGPYDDEEWNKSKQNRETVVKYLLKKYPDDQADVKHYDIEKGSFPRAATFSLFSNTAFKVPANSQGQLNLQQGILAFAQNIGILTSYQILDESGNAQPFLWKTRLRKGLEDVDKTSEATIEQYYLKLYEPYGKSVESEVTAARMGVNIYSVVTAEKQARNYITEAVKKQLDAKILIIGSIEEIVKDKLDRRDFYIGLNSDEKNQEIADDIAKEIKNKKQDKPRYALHTPKEIKHHQNPQQRPQNNYSCLH